MFINKTICAVCMSIVMQSSIVNANECPAQQAYPYNRQEIGTVVGDQYYLQKNDVTATIVAFPVYNIYDKSWYKVKFPGVKNSDGVYEYLDSFHIVYGIGQSILNRCFPFIVGNSYSAYFRGMYNSIYYRLLYNKESTKEQYELTSLASLQIEIDINGMSITVGHQLSPFETLYVDADPSVPTYNMASDENLKNEIISIYAKQKNKSELFFEVMNYITIEKM